MPEIAIEPGGIRTEVCPQCGRDAAVAHGYVYANADAYGIYFADWCEAHAGPRCAFLTLSLGDWGHDASSGNRRAMCLEVGVGGMELTRCPARDRAAFFGKFLPREAAASLAEAIGLSEVVDQIILGDPQIGAIMSWIRDEAQTAFPSGSVR
jgi:hypothetical protein